MRLPAASEAPETAPRRARWMLVDDDPAHLELMTKLLHYFADADIEGFGSGHAAWLAFRMAPHSFDLVITDLVMPDMNGIELCYRVRSVVPDATVLLTSGNPDLRCEAVQRAGFCGLLRKPYLVGALLSAVELAGVPGIRILPAATRATELAAGRLTA